MKVAIIGGGAAGMAAASRVKALRPNWDVMVFEKSGFVSHAPCGIPFYVGGAVDHFEELCAYDVQYFRVERGIDVIQIRESFPLMRGRLRLRREKTEEKK